MAKPVGSTIVNYSLAGMLKAARPSLPAYFLWRLARCFRYFAFCLADPEPCAPVMYFFFLALVFTLPSPSLGWEAGWKTMPFSMTSLIDFMLWVVFLRPLVGRR